MNSEMSTSIPFTFTTSGSALYLDKLMKATNKKTRKDSPKYLANSQDLISNLPFDNPLPINQAQSTNIVKTAAIMPGEKKVE
jgi:translation elongation factor EF-1alpha